VPRVLVADDNSNIHRTIALALKDAGVEVVAVGNGEAAVRKIAEIKPDLVLADIFMPVRNGYEVCEFVKNNPLFSHVPVVLLIGAFDPLDEREAQRVKADAILKKPFVPPDSLLRTVSDLLAHLVPAPVAKVQDAPQAPKPQSSEKTVQAAKPAVVEVEEAPEELELPKPKVEWNTQDTPVAFGSLLESTSERDADDTVITARRDPNLGEPAFWAPKAKDAPEVEASEEEGVESAPLDLVDTESWRPEIEAKEIAGQVSKPAELEFGSDQQEPELQPALEFKPSEDPLPELVASGERIEQASDNSELDAAEEITEVPPWAFSQQQSFQSLPVLETTPVAREKTPPAAFVAPVASVAPSASDEDTAPMPDLKDFSWVTRAPEPDVQPKEHISQIVESAAPPAETAKPVLSTLAPFLASLTSAAALRKDGHDTPTLPQGEASEGPSQQAQEPPPAGRTSSQRASSQVAQASLFDPALIASLSERVLEQLRPEILALISSELSNPTVQALLQEELEKK
jgi:CheY-like chemotaxis protein